MEVSRRLDELGRIVIPAEFIYALGLSAGSSLNMRLEGDCIVMEKPVLSCQLCGGTDSLKNCGGHLICKHCRDLVKDAD